MNGNLHFLVHTTVFGTCWNESLVNIYISCLSHYKVTIALNDCGEGNEVSILDIHVLQQSLAHSNESKLLRITNANN